MYHCHIHFYLTGRQCGVFELAEGMPPLAQATHEFVKSIGLDVASASGADVIFANLQDLDAVETVRALAAVRKKESELILLADKEQIECLEADLEDIKDIWIMPMSEAETKFRLLRWQQAYKAGKEIARERDRAQELLRKNHTLESIFASLDCGVLCHTLDGSRIISVNRAALAVLGYESREEMEAEGFGKAAMAVPDEDREKLWKHISRLKEEGDSVSVEYRMRHRDGKLLHIIENVRLMKESDEPFYRRFFLDNTEQKLQEKENRHRQMEMLQALSVDYNFVCFFDLDTGTGRPIRVHDEDTDIDYNEEFPLQGGMEFYTQNVVYEEDREMFRQRASVERLEQELLEKRIYYVRYRIVHEGEVVYFLLKAVRVGEWAQKRGIVVAFRSVDEETRNEMMKNQLLEDALTQATKASKAKSEFLSNMSHDIRTPMNAIVGFTTLAITRIEKKDMVEDYLRKILTSSNHLLNLINDVLDMSRIESGKMHLEEAPCSLPEILQDLRNILTTNLHEKQLELYMDMAGVIHEEVYCDKLRLNQVLLNLLGNAVKYTGEGGLVSLRILEKPGAPSGSANYEFLVKDTGFGMSEDFVKRIFEPFEREHNHTTSKIQGTGLGMAITKNIIDMMNGSIEVKSEQGIGTEITVTFTFRLYSGGKGEGGIPEANNCRAQAEGGDRDSCDSSRKPLWQDGGKAGESKLHTGRLLLAEDNELNQEIARTVLEDAGFLVDVAENGQIAVDMVRESEPGYYQLILMDVQMPVMNGYEATVKIRELEDKERSSIPILAMTANAFEEDRRKGLNCGMNGYIAKPIDIEKLLHTLDETLAHPRAVFVTSE